VPGFGTGTHLQALAPKKFNFSAPPSAAFAIAMPLTYGMTRVAPNVVWMGPWATVPILDNSTGTPTLVGYMYKVSIMLAVGQGPIAGFGKVWGAQAQGGALSEQDAPWLQDNFDVLLGTFSATPWSGLSSDQALAYRGIAGIAKENWQVGTSKTVPQINVEVKGLHQYSVDIPDAEPSAILIDFLTNPRYGADFPLAHLDVAGSFLDYATCNTALGMFLSPSFDTQKSAAEWIKQIFEMTLVQAIWSDGLIKIRPYYDAVVTGNGVTFTPALDPVVESTGPDDYLVDGQKPPVLARRQLPSDRVNEVRLEVCNRSADYQVVPAYAKSQADIDIYAKRTAQPVQYPAICSLLLGSKVAWLQLQRSLNVMNQYTFILGQQYIWLEPGDIWPLTAPAPLNLTNYPVRIIEVDVDQQERVVVTAEDIGVCNLLGVGGSQSVGAGSPPTSNMDTLESVNAPVLFEMSSDMTAGHLIITMAVSGQLGNLNWGGATVFWSEDNLTFSPLNQTTTPAKTGELLADLAAYGGSNPDNTNTLALDLSESAGVVTSTTNALADGNHNLAVVCDADGTNAEFLSFTTVAPGVDSFQYNCTRLNRGLFGTSPALHAIGSRFAFIGFLTNLDRGLFQWEYPVRLIGETIYFKFVSFDTAEAISQALTDATAYSYTVQGNGKIKTVRATPGVIANNVFTTLMTVTLTGLAVNQPVTLTASGSVTSTGSGSGDTLTVELIKVGGFSDTILASATVAINPDGSVAFEVDALYTSPTSGPSANFALKAKPTTGSGLSANITTATLSTSVLSPNVVP
jgi:hypothetical protein